MSAPNVTGTFKIELPESVLTTFAETPDAFAREIRLAAAIQWYREGRVSEGKAAEIAGLSRTDFLDALRRAQVPATAVIADEVMEEVERVPPDSFEDQYQRIGWWRGPLATSSARQEVHDFWASRGSLGARWLARRLRSESHLELLSEVANLLADLGELSLGPIVEELELEPSRDQAEALLKALAWLGAAGINAGSRAGRLIPILSAALKHDDPDVRDAASRATSLLTPGHARALLESRLAVEPSTEVRQTIEETIAQLHSPQS
jgi:predicted HTH domain antitoxin